MTGQQITMTGLEGLKQSLKKISSPEKIKNIMREEAHHLRKEVENRIENLPVSEEKKAEIRGSLRVEASEDGMRWTIASDSEYGEFLEIGNEKTTILPWLGPSLITYESQYCNCLRDRLITALSTIGSTG